MGTALIKIEHFSFAIGEEKILDDISLTIEAGDHISIVGPNGAGKTTLLKCLVRIHANLDAGILIDGCALENYHQKKLAQLISYVPQATGHDCPFTVYEFVMMGRYPYLNPLSSFSKDDHKAVKDALCLTETQAFAERPIDTLSGGERQRVFIAAALSQGAKILLLDEPTAFLDPRHEADIYQLLSRINCEHGVTVVMVTHNINSAVLGSQRIVAMKDGGIGFVGLPQKFMNNATLEAIYGKKFVFVEHPQSGQRMVLPDEVLAS